MNRHPTDPPTLKFWEADSHLQKTHHGARLDVLIGVHGKADLVFDTHTLITSTGAQGKYEVQGLGEINLPEKSSASLFLPKGVTAVFQQLDVDLINVIQLPEQVFCRVLRGRADYERLKFVAFRDCDDCVLRRSADLLSCIALDTGQTHAALVEPLMDGMAARILLRVDGPAKRGKKTSKAISTQQVAAITKFIDANIASTIRLQDLADLLHLTVFRFSREFKSAANISPMRYVLERRVAAAKRALAGPAPLAEVALDTGFSSQSHFTTAFRLVTGMTPSAWRAAR